MFRCRLELKTSGVAFAAAIAVAFSSSLAEADCNATVVPFEALKVVQSPTRALRRVSLEFQHIASLPPEGRAVSLECGVARGTGRTVCTPPRSPDKVNCIAAAGAQGYASDARPSPIESAAEWAARNYTFDLSGVDGPADLPAHTTITIRFMPSDLTPFVPPPGVEPLLMKAVNWESKALEYAARDQELNFEGDVDVVCQIQGDGHLVCGDVLNPPKPTAFESLPVQVEKSWRTAPTLVDGTPSGGRWVRITASFHLNPPPPAGTKSAGR